MELKFKKDQSVFLLKDIPVLNYSTNSIILRRGTIGIIDKTPTSLDLIHSSTLYYSVKFNVINCLDIILDVNQDLLGDNLWTTKSPL